MSTNVDMYPTYVLATENGKSKVSMWNSFAIQLSQISLGGSL